MHVQELLSKPNIMKIIKIQYFLIERVNKPKYSSINMAVFNSGIQEAPSIFSVFTDLHEYTFCVNEPLFNSYMVFNQATRPVLGNLAGPFIKVRSYLLSNLTSWETELKINGTHPSQLFRIDSFWKSSLSCQVLSNMKAGLRTVWHFYPSDETVTVYEDR